MCATETWDRIIMILDSIDEARRKDMRSKNTKVNRTAASAGVAEPSITCPKCGYEFPLTESLMAPVNEAARRKYELQTSQHDAEIAQREKSLEEREKALAKAGSSIDREVAERVKKERAALAAEQAERDAEARAREKALQAKERKLDAQASRIDRQISDRVKRETERIAGEESKKARLAALADMKQKEQEVRDLEAELKERDVKLAKSRESEADLLRKQRQLETEKQELSLTVEKRVQEELVSVRQRARKEAEVELDRKVQERDAVISDMEKRLAASQTAEAAFTKQRRELDEKQRQMDLTVEKRIREGLEEIHERARREADEEQKLKLAERDETISSMKQKIEELVRKSEQGSQQLQGEVEELQLEDVLREKFPRDNIIPVPKGESGADVKQQVIGPAGQVCGMIVWEAKRTKNWSDGWLAKLRTDQRNCKADVAVLVSEVMPKGVGGFDMQDGVWVTRPELAVPLALALRGSLASIALARQAVDGQHSKMELLYSYLTGPYFRQRVESMVEAFTSMRRDLDKERTVMTKQWAKREGEIQRIMESTAGMYGDLESIAGRTLQQIDGLELGVLGELDDSLEQRHEAMPGESAGIEP